MKSIAKTLKLLKKYFKSIAIFIILGTMIFAILNQVVIRHRINSFINISSDNIKEIKIIRKDLSVITNENKYKMKEVNLNNKEEIKNFFNNFNSIKLKRNYQDELLYKLGQWVSYPEANSNITYTIFINTVNKYI